MPMTDDEARTDHDTLARHLLTVAIERRHFSGGALTQMAVDLFRHCLVALADRAALVERLAAICERQPLTVGEPSATSVLAAARRHMKGEP